MVFPCLLFLRMFLAKLSLYLLVLLQEAANSVSSLFVHASSEAVNSAPTAFRFANIYGDHMVLQAKPFSAMVWGFGEIGQMVDLHLGSEVHTTKVIRGSFYDGCTC